MSANLRLRISTLGGAAAGGPIVTLALAVALALAGCTMGGDQQSAGGDTMSAADSCEQQRERAIQECELRLDPETNQDELFACRAQALEEFQACRGS